MAQTRQSLHHEWRPNVEIRPVNPVYETRMYISGFLGFVGTEYKKEMVSCDGHEEIWTCTVCGKSFEDELHKPEIIRTDRAEIKALQ